MDRSKLRTCGHAQASGRGDWYRVERTQFASCVLGRTYNKLRACDRGGDVPDTARTSAAGSTALDSGCCCIGSCGSSACLAMESWGADLATKGEAGPCAGVQAKQDKQPEQEGGGGGGARSQLNVQAVRHLPIGQARGWGAICHTVHGARRWWLAHGVIGELDLRRLVEQRQHRHVRPANQAAAMLVQLVDQCYKASSLGMIARRQRRDPCTRKCVGHGFTAQASAHTSSFSASVGTLAAGPGCCRQPARTLQHHARKVCGHS
jgi:hypothetical protein